MRILFILLVISLCVECKSRVNTNAYKYFRQINNDTLQKVIVDYAQSTGLNPKSQFVVVYYNSYGPRTSYSISSGKSLGGANLFPPDYFTVVDDILVAIRVSGQNLVDLGEATVEFVQFSKERKVFFESDKGMSYDPPMWLLNRCGENYEVVKKMNPSTQDFLPCDFLLRRELDSDSLFLIQKF